MSTTREKILLLFSDFFAINAASIMLLWLKFIGGKIPVGIELAWREAHPGTAAGPTFFFTLFWYYDVLATIYLCWMLLMVLNGMYRDQHTQSRFDEIINAFKVVTIGTLLWFVVTFDPKDPLPLTRALMFSYWLTLVVLVAGGRVAIRSFQRQLLVRGIGQHNAVIVGSDSRGVRLLHDLRSSPAQGFNIVGFVSARDEEKKEQVEGLPVLGSERELRQIVGDHAVEAVLIALQSNSHEEVLEIVNATEGYPVSFSITPDLYDIVTGHVRTNQIYGVPLMEMRPELMSPWEEAAKRFIDITVAIAVGILLAPLWLLIAIAIKVESPGPILFRQERVGRGGRPFTMFKFRSMVTDAEAATGPVWVGDRDPRITRVGVGLRALHLDEVPQCLNFLRGDMSLVGPRPERPYFVEQFREHIPFYMRRFNVRPGLLGWAQSKHQFDMDSKDWVGIARGRVEYDLYYIENLSLKLDFKIMLQTIWFVLSGKSTR